jgi:hypothetical protein
VHRRIFGPMRDAVMGGWSKLHTEEIHSLYSSPIINLIKAVPLHAIQVFAGEKYSSYSFLTSALNEGEWSESRPGCALVPGKGHLVPTGQEAGWAPEPVLTQRLEEKSLCLCQGSNPDRLVVQSIMRHYND